MPAPPIVEQEGAGTEKKVLTSKKMPERTILWWTRPDPNSIPLEELERLNTQEFGTGLPFSVSDCGLPYTCTFTDDRTLTATKPGKANVLLFSGSSLDPDDLPPADKDQAWILNTVLETPETLSRLDNMNELLFTHSWSHSFAADIVQTTFESRRSLPSKDQAIESKNTDDPVDFLSSIMKPPLVELQEKNRLRTLSKEKGGKAAVAWILESNEQRDTVGSKSRENYMTELLKLIDVDIYGATSMNNTIWPSRNLEQNGIVTAVLIPAQEIMKDYKFVLSLEQVHCTDFVTSTLADALLVGAVPIVDGPTDYAHFSPTTISSKSNYEVIADGDKANNSIGESQSLIQLDDYLAPELLVQTLLAMDEDDSLYLKRLFYRDPSKNLVSPVFQETFGRKDVVLTATTESATKITTTQTLYSWKPDRQGALCKICQMAQELAENKYDWTTTSLARKNNKSLEQNKDPITTPESRWVSTKGLLQTLVGGNNSGAVASSMCSYAEPKYLPGLPLQMKAYNEYLQKEQDRPRPELEPSKIISHAVNVTVSFDTSLSPPPPSTPPETDTNIKELDTWIQSGELSGNMPSVIIHHQDQILDQSMVTPSIQDKETPQQQTSSMSSTSPPPSEMMYLILLILALAVGVVALILLTSKKARSIVSWPWRHLFYKKVATNEEEDYDHEDRLLRRNRYKRQRDRNLATQSLEQVMLSELGEDLLYDV
ncbi:hypothetical protein BGZ83_006059 [Gryganskiella cystojenkinii]|nr:hypothetical protein BGZ83_006059 [Gryganskiella cystojenkinii]